MVSFVIDCTDKQAPATDWPARTGPGEPPPAIIEAERIMKEQREADRAAAERAAATGKEKIAKIGLWGS
jgi:protein phosphatase PTC7